MLSKEQEIHFLVFILCFTVSVTPSINTPEFSLDFMIVIILSTSSFEINKVNLILFLRLFHEFSRFVQQILFGEIILDQNLILFVGSNRLLLVFNDF